MIEAACRAAAPQAERRARHLAGSLAARWVRRCAADATAGRSEEQAHRHGCAAIEAFGRLTATGRLPSTRH